MEIDTGVFLASTFPFSSHFSGGEITRDGIIVVIVVMVVVVVVVTAAARNGFTLRPLFAVIICRLLSPFRLFLFRGRRRGARAFKALHGPALLPRDGSHLLLGRYL